MDSDNEKPNGSFDVNILRFIGKKWVEEILRELEKENKIRFNQLKEKFGITSATLSIIFKEMENFELIEKDKLKTFPPKIEYYLSKKGVALVRVIDKLKDFSKKSGLPLNNFPEENELTMNKELIRCAVKQALLDMGKPELEKVESKLKDYYDCKIDDTLEHPEYLKRVLCELFGTSYRDILNTINKILDDALSKKPVRDFLFVLEN